MNNSRSPPPRDLNDKLDQSLPFYDAFTSNCMGAEVRKKIPAYRLVPLICNIIKGCAPGP